MTKSNCLQYQIKVADLNAHLFEVNLQFKSDGKTEHILSLPNWIPGSYLVRDFAKNIIRLQAFSKQTQISAKKINKHQWQLAAAEEYSITWQVYAYDLSVRCAHIDHHDAFFKGTSVFLVPLEFKHLPCQLDIVPVQNQPTWQVATSLHSPNTYQFGQYYADDYDDLIDHPVELANFSLQSFEVNGIQHDIILSGKHYCDLSRLAKDLKAICQHS